MEKFLIEKLTLKEFNELEPKIQLEAWQQFSNATGVLKIIPHVVAVHKLHFKTLVNAAMLIRQKEIS